MDMREKLVELIAQKVCDTWSESCDEWIPHDCGKCYANDCHIAEVADHILADGWTKQEWISVKDRLPTPYERVLVCRGDLRSENKFICVEYLTVCHGETTMWGGDYETWESKVTHWMPLPQPPKGE